MAVWGPANPAESEPHRASVLRPSTPSPASVAASFAVMGARRLLVFGGLLVLMIRLAPGGMAGLFKQLVWRGAKS